MLTGAALFFADGDTPLAGPIRVEFDLPKGWTAQTPWTPAGNSTFDVASRRELTSNALFLGTAHATTFNAGGVDLTLVLGKRYVPAAARFERLLRTQLEATRSCSADRRAPSATSSSSTRTQAATAARSPAASASSLRAMRMRATKSSGAT